MSCHHFNLKNLDGNAMYQSRLMEVAMLKIRLTMALAAVMSILPVAEAVAARLP